ncbi:TOMM precursor leader peptide-binding protein [Nocardia pseudobrasiliensis]|uniref:Ribosomal protein S12 methylthiotransferase accessory factor n=1 Tax=Nocardia pseudobrasiliensis TaxID=45979 RepID=A0A370I6V6_9NOCA|nr:TOMM precursor leader peptide-binding protein [Nocardia pseudobrasiliensis]RDI66476.1 ribosomal protein S12 methylthiotransferase accessory factor [Nocardia pseudobrasiliensis]
MRRSVLGVVGAGGLIADAILAEIPNSRAIAAGAEADDCALIVESNDGWHAPAARPDRAKPLLPIHTEVWRVVIGPLDIPGVPGCVRCAETRRGLAETDPAAREAVRRQNAADLATRGPTALTASAAALVAALVADEWRRFDEDCRTSGALIFVDLRDLSVSRHPFLPDPLCEICGEPEIDTAEAARFEIRPAAKLGPHTYRVRDIQTEFDRLRELYVDRECGVIRELSRGNQGGLAVAAAPFGMRTGGVERGYGRTSSYRSSELIAVLEALERYGGLYPGGKRTAVRACYREIADHALDPRTLAGHAPHSYDLADFGFVPFHDTRECAWVWGYSFMKEEPILVPESYAYYRVPPRPDEPQRSFYEISNGCALGGCAEEAVLYGILETIERDAFLLTWYARLSVPRIDPGSVSPATAILTATIEREFGYEIQLFDTTMEHGIPSVWAMAVDPSEDPDRPKVVCAAGSHLEAEPALRSALSELGPILSGLVRGYPAEAERAAVMAADPDAVRAMSDHSVLYGHRGVVDRLDFLLKHSGTAAMRASGPSPTGDLGEDLRNVIERLSRCGLDVIVVDQTTPEHRAGDLACVKVIIPGTLPMTFGHRFRRIEGVSRLLTVPAQLGYARGELSMAELNPHPHPFP